MRINGIMVTKCIKITAEYYLGKWHIQLVGRASADDPWYAVADIHNVESAEECRAIMRDMASRRV